MSAGTLSTMGDYVPREPYKEYEFAQKKLGKDGRRFPVQANFCPISVNIKKVYHYNINIEVHDFIKEQGDKNVPQRNRLLQQKRMVRESNFAVFDRLVKQETSLFSSEPIFDGSKNIYSKTKINITDRATFQVKHKIAEKKFPVPFDITITTPKDSHELDMTVLNDKNVKSAEKEIQALDIILAYGAKRYKVAVGSNFFMKSEDLVAMNPNERKRIRFDLGEMKEVSFGHYQSAKLTELGTLLNVDRTAMVFNKGGQIIDLIAQLCTEMRSGKGRKDGAPPKSVEVDANFRLNSNERTLLNDELKGLAFECDHISYRPKNTIFCITDKTVSEIFFEQKTRDSDETIKVSVKAYFEKVYTDYLEKRGRGGLLGNLPCVQVGKMNAKYFPLEVVSILKDQYSQKKLKPYQQSEMTRTCGQQKPTERFSEGIQQVRNLIQAKSGQNDYLKLFNIQMETKYTQVDGRVLDGANLLFNNNKKCQTREGQWRSESYVCAAKDVKSKYMVINYVKDYNHPIRFAPRREQIDEFIKTLVNCGRQVGMDLDKPCEVIYDESYRGAEDLKNAISEYLQDHKDLKLMIFVIPKLDELYNNIKYFTELKYGVVSQCVSQEKSRQFAQMTYVSNLMLKINAKLGGTNVHLAPDSKCGHLKKKTMIMGLDVTHPGRHDRLGNSIAAISATFDSKMVNYYVRTVVQPKPKLEIVLLDEVTFEMLENFKKRNGFYPEFVLVYRDGCSDGQFNEVVDKEINLMKKAFAQISPGYSPKVTFIVAQKRHHTRFLPSNERDRIQRSQNVLPGTIIDNGIVSNYYNEFYLCSHFGALGTSRPTRYIVLHDESEFTGDDIQKTTNLLTYLFPRCSKAVSLASPILYAHLAAKRARSYLFILDNNRGLTFGEAELTPSEIKDLNKKIDVHPSLKNILYFV